MPGGLSPAQQQGLLDDIVQSVGQLPPGAYQLKSDMTGNYILRYVGGDTYAIGGRVLEDGTFLLGTVARLIDWGGVSLG